MDDSAVIDKCRYRIVDAFKRVVAFRADLSGACANDGCTVKNNINAFGVAIGGETNAIQQIFFGIGDSRIDSICYS